MLPSTSPSPRRLLVWALGLAIALAACSTGSTPAPSAAAGTVSPAPTQVPSATAGTASPTQSAAASAAAGTASPTASGASANAVTIQNFAFSPVSLTVKIGTTVTWTNMDSTGHTVTADGGSFGSSRLGNGQTFSQAFIGKFSTAGTYAYHCSIHRGMKATIVVH